MVRVAAYCRVSTDKDDQQNSLESQIRYFHEYINRNSHWELAEIYVDEGITGTSTKKRRAFQKMINDGLEQRFDYILTKEISRFARNTLDSIYYTRKLKELGIGIIFLNDNINTLDSDGELRLTIMSSIAQEESRKTSVRVKWGQKRSMEKGVVFGRDMLGYDVLEGKLFINEEGAKIVNLIFHKFVHEGKGTHVIAKELKEAGITTINNTKEWYGSVILRILKNEKYCGDLIQKKTYTPNYLGHEKKKNRGEEELVILHNHHEPIIDRGLFNLAQKELKSRALKTENNKKYSNRYCFSGLIKCASCGRSYVSRTKKGGEGKVYRYWRCYEAVKHGQKSVWVNGKEEGCNSLSLSEEELKQILKTLVKSLNMDKEGIINDLKENFKKPANISDLENNKKQLDNKLKQLTIKKERLIQLYLENEISKNDFNEKKQKFEKEFNQFEQEWEGYKEKEHVSSPDTINKNAESLEAITKTLKNLLEGEVWIDSFYHNLLEKIMICKDNTIEIYLKYLPEDNCFVGDIHPR